MKESASDDKARIIIKINKLGKIEQMSKGYMGGAVGRERQQTTASRGSVAKRVRGTEHTVAVHRYTHNSAEKMCNESNLILKT